MPKLRSVLIANRGEIAVRIARACRDEGIRSIAVYAEPDRDALHVRVADEAYALGGSTPGDSYLSVEKILDVARRADADSVHPGYGFLAENAEVVQFAKEYGLPVAIKAAYGGGGRGLKIARTVEEVPHLYDSAVREAVAAFGRGECFVERFLDRPRHVETQCLADVNGDVVVVSTRDCSLQRRHQKLVEEVPTPFLTAGQNARLIQ